MRFAIDISLINSDNAGVNQYTREILRELVAHGEHGFILFARKMEQLPFELPSNTELKVLRPQSKLFGGWYSALASRLRRQNVDALVTFALCPAPIFFGRTISFVHDISPLTQTQYSSWWAREKYRLLLKLTMWRSKAVVTISKATAAQLKEMFPKYKKEISVVQPGLSKRFTAEISGVAVEEFKLAHALADKFFLSVGTIQPRKNYITAVKAFHQFLRSNNGATAWQYVIVGRFGWDYQDVIDYIRENKLEDKVKILSRLSDMEVVVAMRAASAFIQLSLEEGFGMPLVEAAANGLPILASDIAVFKEINLDNIIYANPLNENKVAQGLMELSKQHKHGVDLSMAEQFSWGSSAQKLLEVLAKSS